MPPADWHIGVVCPSVHLPVQPSVTLFSVLSCLNRWHTFLPWNILVFFISDLQISLYGLYLHIFWTVYIEQWNQNIKSLKNASLKRGIFGWFKWEGSTNCFQSEGYQICWLCLWKVNLGFLKSMEKIDGDYILLYFMEMDRKKNKKRYIFMLNYT